MKKIFGLATILFFGFAVSGHAQVVQKTETTVKTDAKKVWHGTKKGANTVAEKTKEGANTVAEKTKSGAHSVAQKTKHAYSKTKAKITDKKSEQWVGPEGQEIYVNDAGKYYWIDGSGKRIYVRESTLKTKR